MRQDTAYADEHKYGYRGSEIIRTKHGEPIYAKTEGQQRLVEAIANNDIIFVNGPSGTGKTAISTWLGIAGIDRGIYKHLVLTRPVVTSGEEIGFLPGTMDEKVAPYMEPLYSAISLIKGRRDEKPVESKEQLPVDLSTKEKRKKRAEKKVEAIEEHKSFYDIVQVCPLAFIRGSTLASSFIVCDEFQNTTIAQMKTMLTRIGRGSKMVICGDSKQCDLPENVESGFTHAMRLLKGLKRVAFVELGIDDIVRHGLIKNIILRYERPEEAKNLSEEEAAMDYVKKTHTPGWMKEEDGIDFKDDIEAPDDSTLDIGPVEVVEESSEPSGFEPFDEQELINRENEKYAAEYQEKMEARRGLHHGNWRRTR
jgi:phosphate starvation-inducible PhoH-like protein